MRLRFPHLCALLALAVLPALAWFGRGAAAPATVLIYDDAPAAGWSDWSWSGTIDLAVTNPVYAGTHSIGATLQPWGALSLHHDTAIPLGTENALRFWVHGGTAGGQTLSVFLYDASGNGLTPVALNPYISGGGIVAGQWREARVPLSVLLGTNTSWSRLALWESTGSAQPTFYVDEISLIVDPSLPTATPTAIPTASATPAPALITVSNQPAGLAPAAMGGSNVGVWSGDARYDVPAVRARLAASGITLLRFPGGSRSDEYHWRDHQPPWGPDDYEINTSAFVTLTQEMGAERMFTVNFGSGSAQEAADWVRYTNISNTWTVRYWEIGNEIFGDWETSWTHDAQQYVQGDATHDGFNDFCHAMKAADPTIQVGLIGETSSTSYNNWLPTVLTYADRNCTDFLILHHYPLDSSITDPNVLLAHPQADWPAIFTDVRAAMQQYFGRQLPIHVTEYNSYWGEPPLLASENANLMFLADSRGMIAMQGAAGAQHWMVMNGPSANGGDYGLLLSDQNYLRQPSYYAFPLWSHTGDRLLVSTSNCSTLRVYATRVGLSGDLALLLINEGPGLSATLSLQNITPAGSTADGWQTIGASLTASSVTWNGQANPPDNLSLVPPLSVPITGQTTVLNLPGYSVTALRIPTLAGATHTVYLPVVLR
jgi:alpha-N-arabinofuranosidase